ncbi:hypothetical protein EN745_09650 [Mesorhizobium sp. M4A.F.Ca.ET.022.05.2.1]|uniref:hypothetical protein n=1 Tax=Mesorhizobium sp. M4A.F.Ca.ET.022.05.2.1 TaxID=2496653 RepID=UPI000FCA499E|nr:hypothetical protein [Mesorhizobium sp. M4A.F.Ca.ET.022.05.2.1]RVC81485.1 hypothetical protein EN745_09650 [Mesorhizobium sp. M4A.F.Ca.ET.022.05.2.1]
MTVPALTAVPRPLVICGTAFVRLGYGCKCNAHGDPVDLKLDHAGISSGLPSRYFAGRLATGSAAAKTAGTKGGESCCTEAVSCSL